MAEQTGIEELRPDPKNLRQHGERNMEVIRQSIKEFGVNRPIVVDEDGTVLAGNGVLEAAKAAGITKVRKIDVDGNEIVAVQVDHLTDEQKLQYAVADNRASELSEWDTEALRKAISEEGLDTQGYFHETELSKLIGEVYASEEAAQQAEAHTRKLMDREQRLDREQDVVICPHCYHEWSLEPDDDEGDE